MSWEKLFNLLEPPCLHLKNEGNNTVLIIYQIPHSLQPTQFLARVNLKNEKYNFIVWENWLLEKKKKLHLNFTYPLHQNNFNI